MRLLFTLGCVLIATFSFSQKKQLSHEDLVTWKQIKNPEISNDGNWVAYSLKGEEGDATLQVWSATSGETMTIERGEGALFSEGSEYLVFKIKPYQDTLKAQRRKKVDKDDLPKDTLGILRLSDLDLTKIPKLKSFKMPEKWDGYVVYHKEVEKPKKEEKKKEVMVDSTAVSEVPDSTANEKKEKKKVKKEGKKTGTKLVIRNLSTGNEEVMGFVKKYTLTEAGSRLLFYSTGNDSTMLEGLYMYDCAESELRPMLRGEGDFSGMSFHESGSQLAFYANLDTTDARVAPYGLYHWQNGMDSAQVIADTASNFLTNDWRVSENARLRFSEDGSKLFFGIAPPPILPDTGMLDEEKVQVEVWSYTDGMLHTHQKNELNEEKKRTYRMVYHTEDKGYTQLGSEDFPDTDLGDEGNAKYALGWTNQGYQQLISWEGSDRRDAVLIDTKTGEKKEVVKAAHGFVDFSPSAKYVHWYSRSDSNWVAYSVADGNTRFLTKNLPTVVWNEINDVPNHPWPYGIASWTKDDRSVLVYDRYDIWQIDPSGQEKPVNLTNGRDEKLRYRYVRLDREERFVESGQRMLLHVFNEKTKASGYAYLMLGAGQPIQLVMEDYQYTRRPRKARDASRLVFTKEDFQTFPDLLYSDMSLQNPRRVSNGAPQQSEYSWGTIELVEWTALDGQTLTGMLVKPEGFDPSKKYPMIVNFYEKSSDRLHRYPRPYPGRSTINYSYYASRGYLIFNPDVYYRDGYPGESCENAVLPGVAHLVNQGFVDKERIGVQGHSWGGYQVAHLLTRTDMFRCAESGAPVVNMFSAYGGIRWGSGLSRMFQYERTQSRIGGTIWEYPLRYLENSPIFFLDKVNTPVLILHNDKDGAVPWYQGIEYFVGLRRLGKPAWMLNYNDEPHWPVKLQNRKDFQLRMSQFFDYYLMDAPMPKWMRDGVPAIETGILQGLEPAESKE